MIAITPAQQKRLGQLLMAGIPLPLAITIAMDPQTSLEGVAMTTQAVNTIGQDAVDLVMTPPSKRKRKVSKYARKYKAGFKKVASTYKKANGEWKKGGFRKAVNAAHKIAKAGKK